MCVRRSAPQRAKRSGGRQTARTPADRQVVGAAYAPLGYSSRDKESIGHYLGLNLKRSSDRRFASRAGVRSYNRGFASHRRGRSRAGARSYDSDNEPIAALRRAPTGYDAARNFCRYSAGGTLYQDLKAVVKVLIFE